VITVRYELVLRIKWSNFIFDTKIASGRHIEAIEAKAFKRSIKSLLQIQPGRLAFWRRIFFQILAHPVYKM
jgi:hypothetical protein